MAHFAKLEDGKVVKVHVVANAVITDENGVEQESIGQNFLAELHHYEPSEIVQCSYNGNFRGTYPGVGYSYNSAEDIFVPPVAELEGEDAAAPDSGEQSED